MAVPLKFDFEIFSAIFSRGYSGQVQTEQHWSFDKGLRLFATRFLYQGQHGSCGESRGQPKYGEREVGFLEGHGLLYTGHRNNFSLHLLASLLTTLACFLHLKSLQTHPTGCRVVA